MSRTQELAQGLDAVRARVEAACATAGRSTAEVTLVVVTKYFPAADIARLHRLGVRDVGENRDQEAGAKATALAADPATAGLRWHYIGQLQRNKAASVARYADLVHSVDRPGLVGALDHGAQRAERRLDVLLQVDLDSLAGDNGRGGATPHDLPSLADQVAASPGLRLRGLMAVAPRGQPARPAFELLARLAAALRVEYPDASLLSAGMSADLEDALLCGATHLRVGSAVLGSRPPLG